MPKETFFFISWNDQGTQLAALDHNCGTNRKYAVCANGEIRHKVSYTKETDRTQRKKYLSDLLNVILKIASNAVEAELPDVPDTPGNIAYKNPGKDVVVQKKIDSDDFLE